jgi:hypothetical protein
MCLGIFCMFASFSSFAFFGVALGFSNFAISSRFVFGFRVFSRYVLG